MQAGKLTASIAIQRETETISASGSVAKTWADIANIRAELIQQTATEFLTGYGEAEDGTIVFRVRYRPGITTADRLYYAGRMYDLKKITEIGRQRGLEIFASAIQ